MGDCGCFVFCQTQKSNLRLLDRFAAFRREENNAQATSLMAKDAEWCTLYQDKICGRDEISKWLDQQAAQGRKNVFEGPWQPAESDSKDCFKRKLTVHFPSNATHQVLQEIQLERGRIKRIAIKPFFKSHGVVVAFSIARKMGNDEMALRFMSDDVVWKTYDDFRVQGKDAVRDIFQQQRARREKRTGISDFESVSKVTDAEGSFVRKLEIERGDGAKIRTSQTVTVATLKSGLKIVEVHVHSDEILQHGQWIQLPPSPKRSPLHKKLMKAMSGLLPQ
eukprot:TRINITY_DN44040_c0_g1_i1.p1 TRINITY_DN44040_c0_g1~~TRINITY_DN44040_c0_g1_i1.p1  ORF type:complete len:278 (-),score=43.35 TRINITY_DN44040_c0_g1_i1:132-965(-)